MTGVQTCALPISEYFGDISVTVNDTVSDNEIEAKSTSTYLNKKEIEITIVDEDNINYTNGVLKGVDLDVRTETWMDEDSTAVKLTDRYLQDKFKLYNISRQYILGNIFRATNLRLFSLFTDSGQAGKQFILMGYIHYPIEDIYAVKIYEIDTVTEIILDRKSVV